MWLSGKIKMSCTLARLAGQSGKEVQEGVADGAPGVAARVVRRQKIAKRGKSLREEEDCAEKFCFLQ